MALSGSAALRAQTWVLEARNLTRSYGTRRALDDVSLEVARGEGVALIGPNGSGKSTLLGLVAGVLRPDHGSVLVGGCATVRRRARRAIGYVPQDAAVYDGLTGRENLALFGRLHGLRGAALVQAVGEAIAAAALCEFADLRAATYSGGMRRRLSLACALVHAPALLVLDEPFEGVDESSRGRLLDAIAASKRRGVALVIGTHRREEIGALCERVCELREGRVVAEQRLVASSSRRPVALAGAAGGDR